MANGDYTTLDHVKRQCRIPQDNTSNDDWISETITAISREIDLFCHRHFYPITRSRKYDYQEGRSLYLKEDLHSITQILHGTNREEVLPPSSYFLYPEIGPPYQWIEINQSSTIVFRWSTLTSQQAIQVDGVWGYLEEGTTPVVITRACANWIMYLIAEAKSPGVQSKTIGDYSISYSQVLSAMKDGPPNGVAKSLAYYKRTDIASNLRHKG